MSLISQHSIGNLALVIGLISIFLSTKFNKKLYWVAAFCLYISSYSGHSLFYFPGLYYVNVVFILLTLALGHSLGLITKFSHSLIAVFVGLIIWVITIKTLGHDLLFEPIKWIYYLF